jgi:RNA polymerase sigma-70 factor (ECF subfamily)
MPDRIPLEQLYDEQAEALFGFLLNLTRNDADARDLMQELFLKIARRPDLLDHADTPRSFLLRSAYHLFVDLIRRRQSREKVEEAALMELPLLFEMFEAQEGESDPEWVAGVGRALGELPQEQRAVLHLKIWEGCTFAQISLILGIPGNTAASRYRYALDKMESLLRPVYKELYE